MLHIMVGIPGSGKSTVARNLQRIGTVDMIVCPDSFRELLIVRDGLGGDPFFNVVVEDEVWSRTYESVERGLKNGSNVLVDATNLTKSSRQPWIDYADLYQHHLVAHYVNTPFEECFKRNITRDRVVPTDVMLRFRESASELNSGILRAEGFEVREYVNQDEYLFH